MQKINSYQKSFLDKFNKLIKKINIEPTALNYFTLGVDVPGINYIKFKIYGFKYFKEFLINYLKFFIVIFSRSNIKVYNHLQSNQKNKSKKIIVSWSYKSDFNKNGQYKDKYFNITSNNKEYIWFSIYMDKELPKKIKANVILLKQENSNIALSILNFLNYLMTTLLKSNFNVCKVYREMSYLSFFSKFFLESFKKNIKTREIDKVYIAYEAQPYQKNLIKYLRQTNKKIDIIGYDHTAPQPLPINYYYDRFSPDKLLICSINKFNFNHKFLNWPKKKMKIIPSIRFFNLNKKNFSNKIFLPYMLKDYSLVKNSINDLINRNKINDITKFDIRNHPDQANSKKHLNLKEQIIDLQKSTLRNNVKRNIDKDISIFIGNSTVLSLCIELGLKCYQISLEPTFDTYSNKFWPGVNVSRLNKNIFIYSKRNKETFIKISKKSNSKKFLS